MARTNKMWILKKKQQQAKQKRLMDWWSGESEIWMKKDYTNPKWNNYVRFLRWSKFICDKTSVREDPDWYRILRQANGWEIIFEFRGDWAWWFRRWRRKFRKMSIK